MSPPGRPKGEYRRAEPEGVSVTPSGRPKGDYRGTESDGGSVSAREAYRVDGALVDPADFYRTACDPGRGVVVEACAGAGKTWMLVSRILRALLAGAEPQQILAITFTRKAAGEMRQRLQDWLDEFARADEGRRVEALVQRGCHVDEARALAPALAGLEARLLDAGRAVEIRTFHGWFSQLLRAAPLALLERLGLHPEMELLEDREDLQPQYRRRFLAAVAGDAELRGEHAWLIQVHGRHFVEQWLEAALEQRVELERADAAGMLEASVPEAAALWPVFTGLATPAAALHEPGLKALLAGLARELAANEKQKKQLAAAEGLAAGLHQLNQGDDAAAFEAVWTALHTAEGTPRKQLGDRPAQAEACERLLAIREAIDQQQAHETHRRLVRLSRVLFDAYRDAKRERGLADMADLEQGAERLLADAEVGGWIQERLDARVRHLLIDEFQDTSPLQWRTLDAWLSGYAGAGGGASGQQAPVLFIVGDPKQSIYRFRRADPRVFAQARDYVVQALGGAYLTCDHTRRNAAAVLTALNAVFERAQAAGETEGYRTHTTASDADGAVRLRPAVPRPARAAEAAPESDWRDSLTTPRIEPEEALRLTEARQVADEIAALLTGGLAPKDVMVLGRRRVPLGFVAQALRERGIPNVAPEQRRLTDAPEVRDLLALLDALASPQHDLALAQALKSPLFGASDDDLSRLALAVRSRASPSSWWAVLLDGDEAHAPNLTSPALARARALRPGWADAARVLPPHDLLDRIVAEGQVRERYAAVLPAPGRRAALAAIDALLAQALLQDGGRYATPYGLVRALRRERTPLPPLAEVDAVQLLTIHGAKGLEARAVFVIDAMPTAPRSENASLLIDWPADADAPRRCAFLASESRCPPSLRTLLADEQSGRAREELNALYVAMTRAGQRLVVSATQPYQMPREPSWWQRLADAGVMLQPSAEDPGVVMPSSGDPDGAVTPVLLHVLPAWSAQAERDALPPVAWADAAWVANLASDETPPHDEAAARLGRALHRVLEWLPLPADLERAATAAVREFGLPPDAALRVAAVAAAVLASPACRRFFDPATLLWAGNEVPLVWQGRALRIDRLVALPDEGGIRVWWVLDYKLQQGAEGLAVYREQLTTYRRAVEALRPGDAVRAAVITGGGELIEFEPPGATGGA